MILLIPTWLKGDATAEGTTHGISWIFAIAVLLSKTILLLGSFCWASNEVIPTFTLVVWSLCIKCNHLPQFKGAVHPLFLCKLFVVFLHEFWTNHGRAGRIWDLWVCTFELSSWYLDILSVGEMVLSKGRYCSAGLTPFFVQSTVNAVVVQLTKAHSQGCCLL